MSETESQRLVRESNEILASKRSGYSTNGSGGMLLAALVVFGLVIWSKR